jgi:hypothetical protein
MNRLLTVYHYESFPSLTHQFLFIGIRANIYNYNPETDPGEFILLAVQHYYIVYGKDVEPDKMKQIVQEVLPAPYTTSVQNGDGKAGNKKIKPIMTEKQIDDIVRSAIDKDAEVKSKRRNSDQKSCFFFITV